MLRNLVLLLLVLLWRSDFAWGINNCSIVPAPSGKVCCDRPRLLNNSAFRFCDRTSPFKDAATNGCFEYECFFKENRFFGVDGSFQKEPLLEFMAGMAAATPNSNEKTAELDWRGLIEDSMDTCLKRIEESEQEVRQAYLDAFGIDPLECDARFVAVTSCIYYQVFINCPTEAWENTFGCNDWKEYVLSCLENIENLPIINMDYMYEQIV